MFKEYCARCQTKEYCLEKANCLCAHVENTYGIDDNYGDIDEGKDKFSDLNVYGGVVELIRIKKKRLKSAIWTGFKDDPELISRYHISPGTLQHCVQHNYDNVITAPGAEYFKVMFKKKEIGFVVSVPGPHLLLSFGINKNYRTKEVLSGWLEALKELFHHTFYIVTLYPKNTRAIMFFIRNKFAFSITSENHIVLW